MSNSPQPVPGSLTIFMVGDIGWIGEEIFYTVERTTKWKR
jgi:hypothetical protein